MGPKDVIVVTTENVPGKQVTEVKGLVRGNTIRARHLGRDIGAVFKNFVGGEIRDYTKMMAESREQALDRMREEAASMGANAVLMTRFSTSSMMQNAAELLCYGTAVVVR
ncbi:MAG: YbjQ family protein [Candidatus Zixiibacteriota bacterium]